MGSSGGERSLIPSEVPLVQRVCGEAGAQFQTDPRQTHEQRLGHLRAPRSVERSPPPLKISLHGRRVRPLVDLRVGVVLPGCVAQRPQRIPKLAQEPEWMKLSTVCPAPAGSVLIRDTRAWHGGTPNLSDQVRAIPNTEYHAPWYREPMRRSMPREIYESLSEHGQYIARYVVAEAGEELSTGFREDLGSTPPGLRDNA